MNLIFLLISQSIRRAIAILFSPLHISTIHSAFFGVAVLFMDVGANINTDMAIGIMEARKGIAFFHIDAPTLDAFGHDMVSGDGITGTVIATNFTIPAIVLDAKFEW